MHHDVRGTDHWNTAYAHFEQALLPGVDQITGASDAHQSVADGSVAFTGTTYTDLEGTPETRICIVDSASRELQVLSHGSGDRLPRWSPDGSALAFLSDRTEPGVHQLCLWVNDAVHEAGEIDGSIEWLEWSADGKKILLGAAERGADLAGSQGSSTIAAPQKEAFPSWFPELHAATTVSGWRRLWVYELETKAFSSASRQGLNVWEATWFGDRIAALVSPGPGEEQWYSADLVTIEPNHGTETLLFSSEVQLGHLSASTGTEQLAVVEAICSDRGVTAGELLIVDRNGLVQKVDTGDIDVSWTAWRDDYTVAWMGLRGTESVAGNWSSSRGLEISWRSTTESCGFRHPEGALAANGGFAVVLESYTRYPEIAVLHANGETETLLSLDHPGAEYIRKVGGQTSSYTWTAPDGQKIEGLLTLPEGEGPFPLLMLVHGGPVWSYRPKWSMFYNYTPFFASMGWAVLHPNPRGSSGRGRTFAEAVFGDMGGEDTHDYISGLTSLINDGIADPDRAVVMGASYGGFISSWLPTQTDAFAAAIPIAEVSDWTSQHWTSNIPHFDSIFLGSSPFDNTGNHWRRSPLMSAHKVNTPILHITGALDRCTPPQQAIFFHKALLEVGAVSECLVYPEEGHGVRAFPSVVDHISRITEFLERHLPPA
ncbi:S9 family peptidase [Rhodococcus qingshengii]|uniref:S9 family peptidase n=1 Tax=Rhodococcus qingshengii TaxID=334542 RepID=UPI0036D7DE3B